MRGTTKIKNLGTVELAGVSVAGGRIEVYMPIDEVEGYLEKVFDECATDYMKKHKNVKSIKELDFEVCVIFSCGGFNLGNTNETEFTLLVIVWQKSDDKTGEDTAEWYDDIQISFNDEESKKVKKIIWDGLGETLFNL